MYVLVLAVQERVETVQEGYEKSLDERVLHIFDHDRISVGADLSCGRRSEYKCVSCRYG